MFKFDQKTFWRRLLLTLPIFAITFAVMLLDFSILWRYFAWCNQTLAVFTLWAATVYLARHNRAYIITLLPAMFMTAVSVSYLFAAPRPEGLGQPLSWAIGVGVCSSLALTLIILMYIKKLRNNAPLIRE